MVSNEWKTEVARLFGTGAPDWETRVARLFGMGAFLCGLIGLHAGIVGKSCRLGATRWFTGGILLAALSILMLADAYVEIRRRQLS